MDNPLDPITDQRLRRIEERMPVYDRRLRAVETRITEVAPTIQDTHNKVTELYEIFTAGKVNGKVIAWVAVVIAGFSTFVHFFVDWLHR